MNEHLRSQWRAAQQVEASSWRGLTDDPLWQRVDAAIVPSYTGRLRRFELYIFGVFERQFPTLDEAKSWVWVLWGVDDWRRLTMPKAWVEHHYFGVTDEFTDPLVIYTIGLPSLLSS